MYKYHSLINSPVASGSIYLYHENLVMHPTVHLGQIYMYIYTCRHE